MRVRRIRAIAKKEFIHILRDPFSLTMAIILPIILLLIYGYAVTFDVENIPSCVLDRDKSQESREFLRRVFSSGYFRFLLEVGSEREIDELFSKGKVKVGLYIPEDFGKRVKRGEKAQVGVILDGTDSNTALIVQGYLYEIIARLNESLNEGLFERPFEARTRIWFNSEVKSRNFLIPGLISVIMAVVISLLTSLTVAREWDRGTMEQLISSPVKGEELVLGKIIPYFLIVFLDVILTFLVGTRFFGVPFRGSVVLLFLLSSIFLFGGLSYGVLVSILGRTQTLATQIAMLSTFLPAFLLSGFIFPIANMPEFIRPITYLIPARYYVTILKSLFLKGSTIRFLLLETVLLSIYGVLVFLLAVASFKKRID
jgi:ABC-2 type transport system permease protein